MKKLERRRIWQAGSCFLCLLLTLKTALGIDGEFSGGRITGPLLSMAEFGVVGFALAFLTVFAFPRLGAVLGTAASLLCLPIFLFSIAPRFFGQIFGSGYEWSVRPQHAIYLGPWTTSGSLLLAFTLFLCATNIQQRRTDCPPVTSA